MKTVKLSVLSALERDLRGLGAAVVDSTEAATARAMAAALDSSETSATAKASCARALAEIMGRVRALAPAEGSGDGVDDLTRKRSARRAAVAK